MGKHLSSAGIAKTSMGPEFTSSNGLPQKVAKTERVADSLAGNYDAVKAVTPGQGDGSLSSKVHGTSAVRNILDDTPQMPPVIGQSAVVSAKNFVDTPARAMPKSNKGATRMIL